MILKCKNCGKEKSEPQPEIVGWLCCGEYMPYKEHKKKEIKWMICEDCNTKFYNPNKIEEELNMCKKCIWGFFGNDIRAMHEEMQKLEQ